MKTWYLAAHKYLYFILIIAIEIEEFLEEFFGMQHEDAFWLNFMVDKIVPLICPLLNDIPILYHLTKNSIPYKLSGKTKFPMASCTSIDRQLFRFNMTRTSVSNRFL